GIVSRSRLDCVTNDGDRIADISIATYPCTTGEASSTSRARPLRPFPDLVVSRLASGLPIGADLEFADELTLGSALSGRRVLSGGEEQPARDRKSTRLNSSHVSRSYAVFCLKK